MGKEKVPAHGDRYLATACCNSSAVAAIATAATRIILIVHKILILDFIINDQPIICSKDERGSKKMQRCSCVFLEHIPSTCKS